MDTDCSFGDFRLCGYRLRKFYEKYSKVVSDKTVSGSLGMRLGVACIVNVPNDFDYAVCNVPFI